MRLLIIFILSPFFLFSQTQIGNDIDGLAAGDHSGYVSFSSDGTVVAIGGPGNDDAGADAGHVRVFENSTGNWVQIGNTITGEVAGDNFGASLSLSSNGSILAIGAPYNDDGGFSAGQVQVYENISGTWTQVGSSFIGSTGLNLGSAVSLSNDGSVLALATVTGLTSAYENNGGNWTQIGSDIQISTTYPVKYMKLSGDGTTIALGGNDYYDAWWGTVYYTIITYKNIAGFWKQIGSDGISGVAFGGPYDDLGDIFSLSYNGEILATGGPVSVWVYRNNSNVWTQIGEITLGFFGDGNLNLSNDGSIVAISGREYTQSSETYGFVSVYKNESGIWNKKGDDIIGEGLGDWLHNVNLSSNGDKIAIGSATNDGNGIDSGHVRVYDLNALLSSDDFVLTQFSLFPNPAKDQFTISLNESIELDHINIYNHLAQLISSAQETSVNTSHLSSGMYFVEVITDKGKATKKLILK